MKLWLSRFTSALRTIATDVLSRGEVSVGQQIVSSLFFSGKQQCPSPQPGWLTVQSYQGKKSGGESSEKLFPKISETAVELGDEFHFTF